METYDTFQHKMIASKVVDTYKHFDWPTLWLVADNGSVVTTPEHRFWTGSAWVAAGYLTPGSTIIDSKGQSHKVVMTMSGKNADVYNIHVANQDHDYFAGGYLVHNMKMN